METTSRYTENDSRADERKRELEDWAHKNPFESIAHAQEFLRQKFKKGLSSAAVQVMSAARNAAKEIHLSHVQEVVADMPRSAVTGPDLQSIPLLKVLAFVARVLHESGVAALVVDSDGSYTLRHSGAAHLGTG